MDIFAVIAVALVTLIFVFRRKLFFKGKKGQEKKLSLVRVFFGVLCILLSLIVVMVSILSGRV